MATKPEDLRSEKWMRDVRGPGNGQRTGPDRARMDRDRLFAHERLAAALAGLAPKVAKS